MTKLLIIGGSDAGITAALRARECDPTSEVSIVLADAFPNYSVCGIPFYLSGEVHDWHQLAHRTTQEITDAGIRLFLNTVAESIDPTKHQVTVAGNAMPAQVLSYDRLLIATGAEPMLPSIPGISHPAVFLLRSMEDCFAVDHYATHHHPRTALIIGGGYIGLEMADALTLRGLSVTVVEHAPSVLKTVDPRLGALVRAELERHSVQVVPSVQVERMEETPDQQVKVLGTDGFEQTADLVLVAVGVRPVTRHTLPDSRLERTPLFRSRDAWKPLLLISTQQGIASKRGIVCLITGPISHLGPPRTSKAVSRERTPLVGIGSLQERWGRKW